jgi:hypothetical protein
MGQQVTIESFLRRGSVRIAMRKLRAERREHRLNRRCTGIDSSEVAINVARERMAPLEAQGQLFKSSRETA